MAIGLHGIGEYPITGSSFGAAPPAPSFHASWVGDEDWDMILRTNVASQVVGCQMVSATDGSAFTGSVSVAVTIDGGTQGAGGGSVTHEGNGYHTYLPTQAETNGVRLAYTFTGTGAVPRTVQATGVSFNPADGVRLGLTALPNAAAEASGGLPTLSAAQGSNGTVNVNVHRWLTATPNALQSGRVDSYLGAVASGVIAAASFAAGALDAVWSTTTRLLTAGTNIVLAKGVGITGLNDLSAAQVNAEADTALADVGVTLTVTGRVDAAVSTRLAAASYTAPLDAAGTRTAVGLAAANLDTQLGTIDAVVDSILDDTGTAGVVVASGAKTGYAIGTGGITASSFAAGAIDAAAIAADAIGSSELAGTAVSEIATEVLSAAAATPIAANVQQVNDVALVGDGSTTPWGPA